MGFFNEIKKALFGAKAVTKSAADKVVSKGKEAGGELIDKGEEWFDKAKDAGEEFVESAGDFIGKAKDSAEDFAEKLWEEAEEAVDKVRGPGKTEPVDDLLDADDLLPDVDEPALLDAAVFEEADEPDDIQEIAPPKQPSQLEEAAKKAGDFVEDVGEEVLEKGGELAEKLGQTAEKVGGKVLDAADEIGGELKKKAGDLFEKAREAGSKLEGKAESLFEKAQQEAAKEAESMDEIVEKTQKMGEELKKKVEDRAAGRKEESDSLLGGTDSFFDRARRFAEGDYHNEGARTGDMKISKDPDFKPKPKKEGTVPGFEDLDGDGDELIDDAIIDDEE